jgi:hypothetical protein
MKYTKLYSVLFGSKLYGTSTPASDRDIKHLVLPNLGELLFGKQPKNIVKKTNSAKNTRNTADDVDEEFIPIQIFARDFMMGQTYALELAFSIDSNHAEQTYGTGYAASMVHELLYELREKFLTSNIKAMMGYVVNQATLYSFKGERLNAVKAFLELMEDFMSLVQDKTVLEMYQQSSRFNTEAINIAQEFPKYFKITEYDIGDGRMAPCFMLLDKCLPFSSTMNHTLGVVKKQVSKYGARAEQASESTADWKATMHALRIVDEGLMLLQNHKLVFPLSQDQVQKLLSIKRGEVSIDLVKDELDAKLEQLKTLEKSTTLPSTSPEMMEEFEEWLIPWMFKFYELVAIKL